MVIRTYRDSDEHGWLVCRAVSFLDCSYFNDVKREKEGYPHPSVDLVAVDNGNIIGLLSAELDSCELSINIGRGAIIWHMAVLPEYRNRGVATKLWKTARRMMLAQVSAIVSYGPRRIWRQMSFIGLSAFRLCKTIPGYAVMRGAQSACRCSTAKLLVTSTGPKSWCSALRRTGRMNWGGIAIE